MSSFEQFKIYISDWCGGGKCFCCSCKYQVVMSHAWIVSCFIIDFMCIICACLLFMWSYLLFMCSYLLFMCSYLIFLCLPVSTNVMFACIYAIVSLKSFMWLMLFVKCIYVPTLNKIYFPNYTQLVTLLCWYNNVELLTKSSKSP